MVRGISGLVVAGEKPDTPDQLQPAFERNRDLEPEPVTAIRPRRILIWPVNDGSWFSDVISVRYLIVPLVVTLLSGCERPGNPDALTVVLEETEEPEAFFREGLGRRTRDLDAPGLWAVVANLPRPETAIIRNPRTRSEITVALFAARRSVDPTDVELSAEAAEVLGIGDEPAAVTVTAVRTEPNLIVPKDVF